jgi:hypothetical protein
MNLDRAIAIATEAHAGQVDKAGSPYIDHPLRVMRAQNSDLARIVAVLHDVVEDCDGWTFERLEAEGFKPAVIEALRLVTKIEGEAYEDFVRRAAGNSISRAVKIADLEDNMDVSRLPILTDKDHERLEKYQKAMATLQSGFPIHVAQTEIAPDKIAAYHSTHYRVGSGASSITLMIGAHAPQLHSIFNTASAPCGVLITAFNPFGQQWDQAANLAAQHRLEVELRALTPLVLQAEGADPTGAWPPEPSFFALGINQDTARLLGTQYRQDAVVWVGASAIPELLLLR